MEYLQPVRQEMSSSSNILHNEETLQTKESGTQKETIQEDKSRTKKNDRKGQHNFRQNLLWKTGLCITFNSVVKEITLEMRQGSRKVKFCLTPNAMWQGNPR
jgi:hypothetical protein